MRYAITLQPKFPTAFVALSFEWDSERGTIEGVTPGAAEARRLVETAKIAGVVSVEPHPSTYAIDENAYRDAAQLAAVFGGFWILTEPFASAYPAVDPVDDVAGDTLRVE